MGVYKTFQWFKQGAKVYYNVRIFKNGKIKMPKDMENDIIELIKIIAYKRKELYIKKQEPDEVIDRLWIKTIEILNKLKQKKGNIKTFLSTCYENYIKNICSKKERFIPASNYFENEDYTVDEVLEFLEHKRDENEKD